MYRKSRRLPGDLPQHAETWHVAIRHLRTWITPPDEDPWRPYAVVVLSLDTGVLQAAEITPGQPTPEELLPILFQAMQKPPKGTNQKPHRPQQIQFEDETLAAALNSPLAQIGITAQLHPHLQGIDELLQDLESHLRGGPEHPGLLSVKGVTPELVGGMFAAAAEFYRAAPWVRLTDQQTLAIRVAPEKQPRFAQVMGNGGVEYGLAVYKRWEDVERMYSFADNPLELLSPSGGHSFIFDEISQVPFDDLEAIEKYGWEVADKQAYPVAVIYSREGGVKRPSRADLLWYEAALRAIPRLAGTIFNPASRVIICRPRPPSQSQPIAAKPPFT